MRHDLGFSPNPFGGVCTLACCKPTIRRNANPGDIVIGTGSITCGLSRRLIYAMRVEKVLAFNEYWVRYPSKRPSPRTPVRKMGDNIWHQDAFGKWCCAPGGIHDERNRGRDLSGKNALISSEFYYFGRDAIEIPDKFHYLIASTQGHKKNDDAYLITRFWKWLANRAPKLGRNGLPVSFADQNCGVCECNRESKRSSAPDCGAS